MTSKENPALPRKSPCASCPYRKDVPSGVWDESEYSKLPSYDGEIHEQTNTAVFMCHQQDGCVCSGWLGHRDPLDLLAVRLGISFEILSPSCADYSTDVELFSSGEEAAEHGIAELYSPGSAAQSTIEKIVRKREIANPQESS